MCHWQQGPQRRPKERGSFLRAFWPKLRTTLDGCPQLHCSGLCSSPYLRHQSSFSELLWREASLFGTLGGGVELGLKL